jgi:hypothetical protein
MWYGLSLAVALAGTVGGAFGQSLLLPKGSPPRLRLHSRQNLQDQPPVDGVGILPLALSIDKQSVSVTCICPQSLTQNIGLITLSLPLETLISELPSILRLLTYG